ncbi:MAG: twitching motility protein PilT [Lachnospiraceae bacterium]|nr:twitching motility protein PilT [Lachnospiraceae bacterium]
MIQIISGKKGQGKTKYLLEQVNNAVKDVSGHIVYLDKNTKHMYELNNKIRLISVPSYPVTNCDEFLGFISGILSQDSDIQEAYLDSFLTIADISESDEIENAIEKLDRMSEQFQVKFVLSVSKSENDLPESIRKYITISL